MNTVYLGLGSNIEPEKNLQAALQKLSNQRINIYGLSSIWQTEAVGSTGPAFLNAAARIGSEYSMDYLKEEILCSIEASLGRVRTADKNAPRTIDLDILVFNEVIVDENIFHFDHLILPMAELVPELTDDKTGKTLRELAYEHCCNPAAVKVGKLIY